MVWMKQLKAEKKIKAKPENAKLMNLEVLKFFL